MILNQGSHSLVNPFIAGLSEKFVILCTICAAMPEHNENYSEGVREDTVSQFCGNLFFSVNHNLNFAVMLSSF